VGENHAAHGRPGHDRRLQRGESRRQGLGDTLRVRGVLQGLGTLDEDRAVFARGQEEVAVQDRAHLAQSLEQLLAV